MVFLNDNLDTFNRTIVELKWQKKNNFPMSFLTFNRTIVELKWQKKNNFPMSFLLLIALL